MNIETAIWGGLSGIHAGTGRIAVARADSAADLRSIIDVAGEHGNSVVPVGKGSNLVGSDRDLPMLCLTLSGEFLEFTVHHGHGIVAGGGCVLTALLRHCATLGLGGLSALAGIPGTLGGALAGNAGANGHSIFEAVKSVHGIDLNDGSPWTWTEQEGGWSYRRSPVPRHVLVTGAEIRFEPCNPEEEQLKQQEILDCRRTRTPHGASLGSTFKNPDSLLSAGKLLEDAGCKGLARGVFAVSHLHANWIVNTSGDIGTAEDYRWLVDNMKQRVAEHTGIQLHEEVRFADHLLM